jgi:hypothetical protein
LHQSWPGWVQRSLTPWAGPVGPYPVATVTTIDNTGVGIGIAVFFIAWLVIGVGSLVMLIVALVDIVKRPDWQWKLAGQEKILWLLLVILVNFLAIPSLIYWFNIRKQLKQVEAAAADGRYGPGHMTYGGWEPFPAPLPNPTIAPAGWYHDASGEAQFRWWDGTQWTAHTSAGSPPSP